MTSPKEPARPPHISLSAEKLISKGSPELHAMKAEGLLGIHDMVTPGLRAWVANRDNVIAAVAELLSGGIIFMTGERGVGKTQIAVCVMLDMLDEPDHFTRTRSSVRYIRAAEMFMAFRDAIKDGSERRLLAELSRPRLLVIDDIHEQAGSAHEQRSLTLLIDKRLGASRITMMLSNLKPKKLESAIGESVTDRFYESGRLIQVRGENMRGRPKR